MTERMQFPEIRSGVFVAQGNYAIRRDTNETPAYWIAYRPDGNGRLSLSPAFELGAGAGDQGWAKCVRLCEEHAADPVDAKADIQLSQNGNPTPKTCESDSDNEPKQQGLAL